MADIWIDEFLFRGRDPHDNRPPAWHVTLMARGTDGFGKETTTSRQLNMATAEKEGYPLPTILDSINMQLVSEVGRLTDHLAVVTAEKAEAVVWAQKVVAEANTLAQAQAKKIADLQARGLKLEESSKTGVAMARVNNSLLNQIVAMQKALAEFQKTAKRRGAPVTAYATDEIEKVT